MADYKMISHNDLKKGVRIIFNNQPYEVLEANLVFKGRGNSVVQTKIKNLITNHVISQTFRPSDNLKEAEIQKIPLIFLYHHRDKFVFKDNQSRINLPKDVLKDKIPFLTQNQAVQGLAFNNQIINIELPVKITVKVKEAPPGIKAGRAEAGTKQITLENDTLINAPLFIKQNDLIEINTENGTYLRRPESKNRSA